MRKLVDVVAFIMVFTVIFTVTDNGIRIAKSANKNNGEGNYYVMESSGYYPGAECCHPFDDGFTAIGDVAGKGSIAIDDVSGPLRMGQRVYVEGYGYGKCNDRGSAIKDWKIDLCFDTLQEAKNWGRRLVRVYIIKGD